MRWKRRALALSLALVCTLGHASARDAVRAGGATNPLSSLRRRLDEAPLRARIEQRLAAGSYTYLALRDERGALHWAVMLGAGPPAGARVSVRSLGHKRDFYSRRLARTFPDLMFGIVSRVD